VRTAKLVVLAIMAAVVGALVLQNTAPVQARFLWMTAEMPVIVLLVLTTLGGFAIGAAVTLMLSRRMRSERGAP